VIDALLVISLVFGGIAVDLASRTPTVMYFDLLLPLVFGFRVLWVDWPAFSDSLFTIAVSACLLSQAITAITSPQDIYKSLLTMKCLLWGFLLYRMLEKRGVPEWCVPVWLGAAGTFTLLPFYSALHGGMNSVSAIKDAVVTPMGPNNYVACYLMMLLPLGAVLFYRCSYGYKKFVYGIGLFLGLAGFFVTFSRAAFVSLLLAVLLSIHFIYRSGFRLKHSAIVLVFLGTTLGLFSQQVAFAYEFVVDKISIGDEARMDLWRKAINTFEENPIFGVGPGQFVNYTHETGNDNGRLGAHNTYLQALAEGGILGSIPVFLLIFVIVRRSYILARCAYEPIRVAVWIGLLATIIHNSFDSIFWTQHFQALFWLLTAISVFGFSASAGKEVTATRFGVWPVPNVQARVR
jgi:O-antigen ligase